MKVKETNEAIKHVSFNLGVYKRGEGGFQLNPSNRLVSNCAETKEQSRGSGE